jgi:tetratricopeptide (TPR) repeat protein
MERSPKRLLLITTLVCLCLISAPTASPWQQPEVPVTADTLVRHVRLALGRGAVDRARTLASSTEAPADVKAVAVALVEIFEGKVADARGRLTPLVASGDRADALLELGLLDMREGKRDSGLSRLTLMVEQTSDMTPENTFRLARAAYALGDIRLANSLFQRAGNVPLQTADMETTWGDMLLEKHQAGEAVRSYRAALDADPAWIRAHLGISRALENEDAVASEAALEKAGSLAPSHPDVWLLTAERRLAAEDRNRAAEALDKVAAVRPGTYEEIALRAAVTYANGDIAAADAMIARAVAANPTFVNGYLSLGAQAARAYRFEDAAAYARKAVALEAEHPGAHADLGLYLMRTGDEAPAREELERAFKLDPFDTVTFNLLTLLDTLATFVEVESGPFIFKFPKAEAEVLKPYALPLADLAYKTFSERYAFTPKGPILVEVFGKHDDFAVRTMGLPGLQFALGACFGRVITMDSPMTMRVSNVQPFSWQATLWHEIAHVFTLQASDYKVPRWLTEGISVFEEHRYNKAWGREQALDFARALATKRTFGVKGLPNAFERPQDLSMAYFEASLLTEYLVTINGDAGLRALLSAYAAGAKDADAFAKAFGKTVDEVHTGFAAFVETQYGELARAMADAPGNAASAGAGRGAKPRSIEELTALAAKQPGNFVVQWSLGSALYERGDLDEAKAALERAAALAPMAQGETSPRALLAAIADKQGDGAKVRNELRQLLVWDHDNVEAARRLVTSARAAGDKESETLALRVIADVDPFDASAHAYLGKLALERKEFAPALVELLAALALGPPNLAEAHADVAEAYLGLGRKDDARKAALKALEHAPTFPRAQDLLLAAMGGR